MHNRVKVNKNILKMYLSSKEDISKSLSRFINNSIEARKEITTSENPCEVTINLYRNSIEIIDNSGGIKSDIKDEDVFRIGKTEGKQGLGLGIKKSLFSIANKMDITSNRKGCSRKLSLDMNFSSYELAYESKNIDYNPNVVEGTTISISNLENHINNQIIHSECIKNISFKLGRMYSKFIKKGELIIFVNEEEVIAKDFDAELIRSCTILGHYKVDLYKGSKDDTSGIDVFINDYMIYNREKKAKKIKWNLLKEHNYTYKNCIVEISGCVDEAKFFQDEEELFNEVRKFIKENKEHFKSETITIQYEKPIQKVENLKKYYNIKSAKDIGIKGFDKLYEEYEKNIL